jgi:hypothetical protein
MQGVRQERTEGVEMRECEWCGDKAEVVVSTPDGEVVLCLSAEGCATDPEYADYPQHSL